MPNGLLHSSKGGLIEILFRRSGRAVRGLAFGLRLGLGLLWHGPIMPCLQGVSRAKNFKLYHYQAPASIAISSRNLIH